MNTIKLFVAIVVLGGPAAAQDDDSFAKAAADARQLADEALALGDIDKAAYHLRRFETFASPAQAATLRRRYVAAGGKLYWDNSASAASTPTMRGTMRGNDRAVPVSPGRGQAHANDDLAQATSSLRPTLLQVEGTIGTCVHALDIVQYHLDRAVTPAEKTRLMRQKATAANCVTTWTALGREALTLQTEDRRIWGPLRELDNAPAGSDGASKAVALRKQATAISRRIDDWNTKADKAMALAEEGTTILQTVGR